MVGSAALEPLNRSELPNASLLGGAADDPSRNVPNNGPELFNDEAVMYRDTSGIPQEAEKLGVGENTPDAFCDGVGIPPVPGRACESGRASDMSLCDLTLRMWENVQALEPIRMGEAVR